MGLKKIAYPLIVSMVVSFFNRTAGTIFPFIFQNAFVVKFAVVINTFFMFVQAVFFVYFLKSYAFLY